MKNGIVNIHGREYKTVALRVTEFRQKYPIESGWGIITEVIRADDQACLVVAKVVSPEGATIANGHAEENRAAKGINFTSALENAETSAIGRALAAAGFGGDEYASADEVANAIKADKPQPKPVVKEKPELIKGSEAYGKVVKAIERDGYTVSDVEKKYRLTAEIRRELELIKSFADINTGDLQS